MSESLPKPIIMECPDCPSATFYVLDEDFCECSHCGKIMPTPKDVTNK